MANGKAPAYQNIKKYKYPNSSIFLDATCFYMSTNMLTSEEIGSLMTNIFASVMDGKFEEVQKYNFITRIIKGPQKRKYIPFDIRKKILSHGQCVFCGDTKRLSIDHIIPITHGGTNDESNLQCLCLKCNLKKGNKILNGLEKNNE